MAFRRFGRAVKSLSALEHDVGDVANSLAHATYTMAKMSNDVTDIKDQTQECSKKLDEFGEECPDNGQHGQE